MSDTAYIVEESSVPWEGGEGGVTWRTLTSADRTPTTDLTSGVCEIAPGGALTLHRHPTLEIYYFTAGRGRVRLGHTEHDVGPGVAVSIPSDLPHALYNTGSETLRFFYAFPVHSFSEVVYTDL